MEARSAFFLSLCVSEGRTDDVEREVPYGYDKFDPSDAPDGADAPDGLEEEGISPSCLRAAMVVVHVPLGVATCALPTPIPEPRLIKDVCILFSARVRDARVRLVTISIVFLFLSATARPYLAASQAKLKFLVQPPIDQSFCGANKNLEVHTGRESRLRKRGVGFPTTEISKSWIVMTNDVDTSRRSGRRTNSRYGRSNFQASQHVPSAVHYVGYVEEDETPEMIMAKFAELEEIQRKASEASEAREVGETKADGSREMCDDQDGIAGGTGGLDDTAGGLTDEQLLQVFKQTSMFNVKTALQDNVMLTGIDDILGDLDERYGSDDDFDSEDEDMLRSFWSDDEDWDGGKRRRKGKGAGAKRSGIKRGGIAQPKARHRVVTAYNPLTQALVRKKVKVSDPNQLEYIRIPSPLPLSWGRTIAPFKKPVVREHRGLESSKSVAEAVLVNEAWYKDINDSNKISANAMKRLSAVSFNRVVPYGFVFVWTPKELVHPVCKLMLKQGFAYVENLTWVWMQPNNTIAEDASEYICRSHLTLYMFRAVCADRSKVELRHQRSPDVIFDYRKDGDRCPTTTYEYLETLLPKSTRENKLVEMFGKPQYNTRDGWKVVEYDFSG